MVSGGHLILSSIQCSSPCCPHVRRPQLPPTTRMPPPAREAVTAGLTESSCIHTSDFVSNTTEQATPVIEVPAQYHDGGASSHEEPLREGRAAAVTARRGWPTRVQDVKQKPVSRCFRHEFSKA